jgi:alcohol dehydrogenase
MKAAVVPAKSSSWQIKDVPQPQPGPGQVLVKMRASGICYTDVHQTLGHLPDNFLESLATSRSARSSLWLLM